MKKLFLALSMLCLSYSAFASGLQSTNPLDIMQFIQGQSPVIYFSMFFGLGVLLAFTPCVLPMVPILSSIITGQGVSSGRQAFKLSLGYVLGMAFTYALAGMFAAWLGSTVQTLMQQPFIIGAFSILLVLMALWLLGVFELRLPVAKGLARKSATGVLSAALMGVVSTLVVSPCVTAPLIGLLTYIAETKNVVHGGLLLFVLALGMGLPLLLVGAGFGRFIPKSGPWMVLVKQVFGIMMLAMSVWMLSRIIPEVWTNWLWVAVLLMAAWVFGRSRFENNSASKLIQGFALLSMMGAGAVAYQTITLNTVKASGSVPFITVNTLEEINTQLVKASENKKRVFVEFYASWCGDCKAMDKYVFNQAEVIDSLKDAVTLRVDISDKTKAVATIREVFGIYGIPTMHFYDKEGKMLSNLSASGQLSKAQTLALLAAFQN